MMDINPSTTLRVGLLLVLGCAERANSHAAMVFPPTRNSIDKNLPDFQGGASPDTVRSPHKPLARLLKKLVLQAACNGRVPSALADHHPAACTMRHGSTKGVRATPFQGVA